MNACPTWGRPGSASSSLQALPGYVNGESVEGKSPVLWYWLGFHHFPRSEDFLHQPMVWKSLSLEQR